MRVKIRSYIKNCSEFQRSKSTIEKLYGTLRPFTTPCNKWKAISMDFISVLCQEKKNELNFSYSLQIFKCTHFIPMNPNIKAKDTTEAFYKEV